MFAGRYLWWTLLAAGTFVFFAIYFDYASWAIVQTSGCDDGVVSCDPLNHFLAGTLQPAGFATVGAILMLCTIGRILYLRLPLFWALAIFVWCLGSTDFPGIFATFWRGQVTTAALFMALPLPMLYFGVLVGYLLLPFEEEDRPVFGIWRNVRWCLTATAAYGVLLTLAQNSHLPKFLLSELHLTTTSLYIQAIQAPLARVLQLGMGGNVAGYASLMVFALLLCISLVPEERYLQLLDRYYRFRIAQHPWLRLRQFDERL